MMRKAKNSLFFEKKNLILFFFISMTCANLELRSKFVLILLKVCSSDR